MSFSPLEISLLAVLATLFVVAGLYYKRHVLSERIFSYSFHSIPVPLLVTGPDGAYVAANRSFQSWFGENPQEGLVEEKLALRLQQDPIGRSEFERLCKMGHNGEMAVSEIAFIGQEQGFEWRRVQCKGIEGYKGYISWRFEDVTAKRRIEDELREEQRNLNEFMANAPIGIYSANERGEVIFINRTLGQWLGLSSDLLVQQTLHLNDLIQHRSEGLLPYAITTGPEGLHGGEVVLRRTDGQTFPASIAQIVVGSQQGLRTRSIVHNLSAERRYQDVLNLAIQRFQRLFAEAPIGIAVVNNDLQIVEINSALCHLLGIEEARLLGQSINDILDQGQAKAVMDKLTAALRDDDIFKPFQIVIRAEKVVHVQIFARKFSDGRDSGLVIHFSDLTEQKSLEAKLVQSQKMQAIGQLAGGIAHDFNNLLTAMSGYCDLILTRYKPGDQTFNDVMQVKQNANRAANLVRQLLAFSRQQPMQSKTINIADALSELSNLLRRLIGANIEMDIILSREIGLIRFDQSQLEQVIINLAVNARDAMPNGGKLIVKNYNHSQRIPVMRGQDEMVPGDYVVIEIIDTGIGIPFENLQRIFEPFFTTKEAGSGSGTGLGLATVYGIVRQSGGYVGVDSKPGSGTTFSIYLPRYFEAAKPIEAPDATRAADLTGAGTIMIVEDEDAVRAFSTRALRNKGYHVLEAASGEDALGLLNQEGVSVDLIISDVIMPKMDGPTLIANVRRDHPKMKVIFISGYTEDRFRGQFAEGEAIHFLGKPFSLSELAQKVKEVMSGTAEANLTV